jgi:hypothetical protein
MSPAADKLQDLPGMYPIYKSPVAGDPEQID